MSGKDHVYNRGHWSVEELSHEQNELVYQRFESAFRTAHLGPFALHIYPFERGPEAVLRYLGTLILMPDGEEYGSSDEESIVFETILFPDLPSLLMFLKEYGGTAK